MSEKKTNHSVSFEALSSLDAPVSFWKGIPFGLQHVMAMFVANLAPIFIVASAAKMTPAESATIIQSGLLVAGLGTCLQLYGAWLIGSRLPMVTGISFTYVAAAVAICADKGYGAVVGAVMVGGLLELVLGLTAKYWRRFVPPIVSAIVVTSIGFSLLNVGATSFGGGSGAKDFGSWQNLTLGLYIFGCLPGVPAVDEGHGQAAVRAVRSGGRLCGGYLHGQGRFLRFPEPRHRVRAAVHAVQA